MICDIGYPLLGGITRQPANACSPMLPQELDLSIEMLDIANLSVMHRWCLAWVWWLHSGLILVQSYSILGVGGSPSHLQESQPLFSLLEGSSFLKRPTALSREERCTMAISPSLSSSNPKSETLLANACVGNVQSPIFHMHMGKVLPTHVRLDLWHIRMLSG